MHAGHSSARQARTRHRYELRTLTYVTLDHANGGIVRNLTHDGIAVQAVAAVRPRQQLRVRFELRYPQLRVEARGEVVWATFSGQCGIRFLDLSPRLARQIDQWIMGNLLEGALVHHGNGDSLAEAPALVATPAAGAEENDGLMVSPAPVRVIELPVRSESTLPNPDVPTLLETVPSGPAELDWLSQPLSGRSLAWTVNALVVVAGLLLSAFVFLSVTREMPKWPFAMAFGASVVVVALYWAFFRFFGGSSPGDRLARLTGPRGEENEQVLEDRFR